METELPWIDTPQATVGYTAPALLEVRFKPGRSLTMDGVNQMMEARQRLSMLGKHRILMVLPQEVVHFDMEAISTDHNRNHPQPNTEAVAWAAWSVRNQQIVRLYEAYWPTEFPVEVFLTEEEARRWLACNEARKEDKGGSGM
jgi:hypothetical protein